MAETKTAVETKVETAVTPLVVVDTAPDYEKLLAEKNVALAKAKEERENYRRGMLKAKGKLPDSNKSGDETPGLSELVAEEVKAQLLNTTEARLTAERDELNEKILKENRELRIAVANKGGVSNSPVGTGVEATQTPKDQFFSDAQITDLKKRGWDDKKIDALRKNMAKTVQ